MAASIIAVLGQEGHGGGRFLGSRCGGWFVLGQKGQGGGRFLAAGVAASMTVRISWSTMTFSADGGYLRTRNLERLIGCPKEGDSGDPPFLRAETRGWEIS